MAPLDTTPDGSDIVSSAQDESEPGVSAAAPSAAAREQIIQTIRRQAEETIAHLQQDVFRLIDQTRMEQGAGTEPASAEGAAYAPGASVTAAPPVDVEGGDVPRSPRAGRSPALSEEQHEAVTEVVRAEIAGLNLPEVVAGEVRRQMQLFVEQVNERIKERERLSTKKLSPLSSRRRR